MILDVPQLLPLNALVSSLVAVVFECDVECKNIVDCEYYEGEKTKGDSHPSCGSSVLGSIIGQVDDAYYAKNVESITMTIVS